MIGKTVAFSFEANDRIGLGHMMRCCVLASAFYKRECKIIFVSSAATLQLVPLSSEFEFLGVEHPVEAGCSGFAKIEAEYQITHWVLDSYALNGDEINACRRQLKSVLLLMDDENNRGQLAVDIVINTSLAANDLGYGNTAAKALKLLGPSYSLLRAEFDIDIPNEFKERECCLITMGGADPRGLTLPILNALLQSQIVAPIIVITGDANPKAREIKKIAEDNAERVTWLHAATNMAEHMLKARLAIAAAGSTIAELGVMQVPSILCVVADNQQPAAEANSAQGWCKVVDCRSESPLATIEESARQLWQDDLKLENMASASRGLYNLDGAKKVVDEVLRYRK